MEAVEAAAAPDDATFQGASPTYLAAAPSEEPRALPPRRHAGESHRDVHGQYRRLLWVCSRPRTFAAT